MTSHREPVAWTRWVSGVLAPTTDDIDHGARCVRTGLLFDAVVTDLAVGTAAVSLIGASGLPVGPVASSRNRIQVLVPAGVALCWERMLEQLGRPAVDTLRALGADGLLWLPPVDGGATTRWVVAPSLSPAGLPVFTDPQDLLLQLQVAARREIDAVASDAARGLT